MNSISLDSLNSRVNSENPFALLGSDKWAGRPTARNDANPSPSKRARPAEAYTQRATSKIDKKKGKAKSSGSITTLDKITFSAHQEPPQGSVILVDTGVQSPCKQSLTLEGVKGVPASHLT